MTFTLPSLPLAPLARSRFSCLLAGRWGLLLLLLVSPAPARSSQLIWELEPEPAVRGEPQQQSAAASGLVWVADDEPLPQLMPPAPAELADDPSAPADLAATEAAPAAQEAGSAEPLTSEDLAELLLSLPEPYSPPNLGGGLPSAYVANWGDFYFTGSAGTAGKQRDSQPDGSVGAGIGFGNAQELIAVELNWGVGSIRNFNANGAFNLFASRMLVNQPRLQVLVGGGVFDLVTYGNERPQPDPTGFGVLTMALPLREPNFEFNQVLQLSVGVGGRDFVALDENFEGDEVSAFGAVGVELAPNLGLSAGISGRGTNINLSYTPFRQLPISVNLLAADVFDQSPFGTVGVLTVSWGDNFRRGLF